MAQELLLARPWEDEGELRWRRDLGGARLIGRRLAEDAGESDGLLSNWGVAEPDPRHAKRARR